MATPFTQVSTTASHFVQGGVGLSVTAPSLAHHSFLYPPTHQVQCCTLFYASTGAHTVPTGHVHRNAAESKSAGEGTHLSTSPAGRPSLTPPVVAPVDVGVAARVTDVAGAAIPASGWARDLQKNDRRDMSSCEHKVSVQSGVAASVARQGGACRYDATRRSKTRARLRALNVMIGHAWRRNATDSLLP
jgi:hypothetical protein